MNNVQKIRTLVKDYYAKPNPVINWNHYIFDGHNEIVANWVREIVQKYPCDSESIEIAAYLHDLAYAWTDKHDPTLEEQSEAEARKILIREGFDNNKVILIVDTIIHGHGMYDGKEPDALETKVFATADALAHFTTDFYLVLCWEHYLFEKKSLADYKAWVLKKIERDFHNKIFFPEFKEIARPYYESLKRLFSL